MVTVFIRLVIAVVYILHLLSYSKCLFACVFPIQTLFPGWLVYK